jgi:hypothetical protein
VRIHRDKFIKLKRDFTFGDALKEYFPKRLNFIFEEKAEKIIIKYKNDNNETVELNYPIIIDPIDKKTKSFVGMVPIEIVDHDASVNPRSIVDLELMIEEFYNNNPQLFPSLAIIENVDNEHNTIMTFDGQHKAAAQLYLRSKYLFLRVFINIEKSKIKKTNLRAHTVVAQIHFPKLIEDKVGHDLFLIEFEPFISSNKTKTSEQLFIKQDEINDEYRKYLSNFYKYNALFDSNGERHCILDYVETITARSKTYPISYDTLSKTFLKMLYLKPTEEKLSVSIDYRNIETANIWRIMNIFIDKCLKNKFDIETGIYKIEDKLISDPNSVTDEHLIAYRLCRQAAMIIWVEEFRKSLSLFLKTKIKFDEAEWSKERVLWSRIDDTDFEVIGKMFTVIRDHKIWREKHNAEIISSLGSTKISDWKNLLLNGKLPGREEKLFDPINDTVIFNKAISM